MNFSLALREIVFCLIILLFLFFTSNIFLDVDKKQYKRATLYASLHLIIGAISLFIIAQDVHVIIKNFFTITYLIFAILFSAEFFIYCFKITISESKKAIQGINIVIVFSILILPLFQLHYDNNGRLSYPTGPQVIAVLVIMLCFYLASLILLLTKSKAIFKAKKLVLYPISLINIILLVYNIFNISYLFTGIVCTLGALGLFCGMENSMSKYKRIVSIDYSSGLRNRSYFDEDIKRLNEKYFVKDNKPMICLIFDINKLNDFNEKYGHIEGDNLIKVTAKLLQDNLKSAYEIYRYSGDQFIAFYIGDKTFYVNQEIDDLKENLDLKGLVHIEPSYSISLSMGIQEKNESIKNIDELINFADRNLYIAKQKFKRNSIR